MERTRKMYKLALLSAAAVLWELGSLLPCFAYLQKVRLGGARSGGPAYARYDAQYKFCKEGEADDRARAHDAHHDGQRARQGFKRPCVDERVAATTSEFNFCCSLGALPTLTGPEPGCKQSREVRRSRGCR